ncbi:MAG: hypothetical protein WC764_02600 [Candidatus Paceibacterota bacterium]|jgi:hypothetical protein
MSIKRISGVVALLATAGIASVAMAVGPGAPATPTITGGNLVSGTIYASSTTAIQANVNFTGVGADVSDHILLYLDGSLFGGKDYTITGSELVSTTNNPVEFQFVGSDLTTEVSHNITAVASTTSGGGFSVESAPATVIFDNTTPTLPTVSIASNAASTTLAGVGRTITVSVSASENLDPAKVTGTIAGQTATVSGSGSSYTLSYTMTGSDTPEIVPFAINFSDLAGNAGTQVVSTTDASSVTFEKTLPTLSAIIYSSNASSTLAKSGDIITIAASSSEEIFPVSATIAGQTATVASTSPTDYYFTTTVDGSHAEGPVALAIDFSDLAGNAGTQVVSATGVVSIDKTAPTAGISYDINHAVKNGTSLTITATTTESLITAPLISITVPVGGSNAVSNVSMSTSNDKVYVYSYTVGTNDGTASIALSGTTDLAGNTITVTPTNGTTFTVDNTVPAAPVVTTVGGTDNKVNASEASAIIVVGTAEANATTTVSITDGVNTVTKDGLADGSGNYSITLNGTTAVPAALADGVITASVTATDIAGNTGPAGTKAVLQNTSVPIAPVPSITNNINSAASTTVALIGTAQSNTTLYYSISDGTKYLTGTSTVVAGAFNVTGLNLSTFNEGSITATTTVTDSVGNVSSVGIATPGTKDTVAPVFSSVTPATNAYIKNVTTSTQLGYTLGESLASGLAVFTRTGGTADGTVHSCALAGTAKTTGAPRTLDISNTTNGCTIVQSLVSGSVYSIDFGGSDAAGNNSATTTVTGVTFDNTLPTLSPVSIASSNASTTLAKAGDVVTLSFTSDEPIQTPTVTIAGHSATVLDMGSNVWNASTTVLIGDTNAATSFTIDFTDLANNAGTQVVAITSGSPVVIDTVAPTATLAYSPTTAVKPGASLVITATLSEPIADAPVLNFDISGPYTQSAAAMTKTDSTHYATTTIVGVGNGSASVNLSNATDLAGNAITGLPTSGATFTVDNAVPTLSGVSISSSNTTPTLAKAGNIITLAFTSNETVQTPTVTIATHSATVLNMGGNVWNASTTVLSNDSNAVTPFAIDFSDIAGNAGTQVTTTNDASGVVIDTVLPNLYLETAIASLVNTATPSFAFRSDEAGNVSYSGGCTATTPSVTTATTTITYNSLTDATYGSCAVKVTDATGNQSLSLTLPSFTIDTLAPTLSSRSISSNNSSTTLAVVGDVVTLSITSSENLAFATSTIAGRSAVLATTSPTTFTFTITMNSGDAETVIPFTIDFTDFAGNSGTQVSTVSSGSNVVFDKTAPTLSSVAMVSNNASTTLAKSGNIITLSFTSSEPIQNPSTTVIAGHLATVTGSGTTWTATYTMSTGSQSDGPVTFTIDFKDKAGNDGTTVSATTDSSAVTFDKTAPTLSSVSIASDNASTSLAKVGDTITLSFTSSEPLLAAGGTIAGHTATLATTSPTTFTLTTTMLAGDTTGTVSFSVTFTDNAGNAGSAVSVTSNGTSVKFDKTNPTVSAGSDASANAQFTQNATASDAGSGIATYSWTKTAGSGTITFGTPVAEDTTVSASVDGAYTIQLVATDNAGNTATSTATVTWDATAPTIDITAPIEGLTIATTTSLTVTTSETATCTYSLDSATSVTLSTTGGTSHSDTLSNVASGAHSLTTTCTDLAANIATSSTRSFTALTTSGSSITGGSGPVVLDSTPNDGDVALPGGVTSLTLSASSPLSASTSLSTVVPGSPGSLMLNGAPVLLNNFTIGTTTRVGLTTAQTVGDKTITVGTGFTLQSGTNGTPITIVGSGTGVSMDLPDGVSILGPTGWNGQVLPPSGGTTNGSAPSGFTVGDSFEIGSSDVPLLLTQAATITFPTIKPMVMRVTGSNTWNTLSTCAGTYAVPTAPAAFGECAIAGTSATKVLTYHLTTFGTITTIPATVTQSSNGPIIGSYGGNNGSASVTTPTPTPTPTATKTTSVVSKITTKVPTTTTTGNKITAQTPATSRAALIAKLNSQLAQLRRQLALLKNNAPASSVTNIAKVKPKVVPPIANISALNEEKVTAPKATTTKKSTGFFGKVLNFFGF